MTLIDLFTKAIYVIFEGVLEGGVGLFSFSFLHLQSAALKTPLGVVEEEEERLLFA